ncbi:MAG TPA: hypothetical protein VFL36_23070 [Myxococcales bacterium]|nr:hypothetical protein [Myxococcales bacterium]
MLVRDGTKLPSDPTGLWQAVRGNRRAEEHAARYGMWRSFGLASLLLGSGLAAGAGYAESQGGVPARNVLASAAASVALGGLVMFVVAQPHYYDAINVYNDGLDAGASMKARQERAMCREGLTRLSSGSPPSGCAPVDNPDPSDAPRATAASFHPFGSRFAH